MPACRRAFASFAKVPSPCGCFAESLALALAVYANINEYQTHRQYVNKDKPEGLHPSCKCRSVVKENPRGMDDRSKCSEKRKQKLIPAFLNKIILSCTLKKLP
jgi:hypothetical protein